MPPLNEAAGSVPQTTTHWKDSIQKIHLPSETMWDDCFSYLPKTECNNLLVSKAICYIPHRRMYCESESIMDSSPNTNAHLALTTHNVWVSSPCFIANDGSGSIHLSRPWPEQGSELTLVLVGQPVELISTAVTSPTLSFL